MKRKTANDMEYVWNWLMCVIAISSIAIIDWQIAVFITGMGALLFLLFKGPKILAFVWNFIADRVGNKHVDDDG